MIKPNAQNYRSVEDYIATLDDQTTADTKVLIDMFSRISGHEPKMWGIATMGFDSYHYKYDSGHEGDSHVIGFYPRNGKITVYLMDGTAKYADQLAKLGKHTKSTRVCIYIKRLSDIDLDVLERVVTASYKYVKSHDGNMHRAEG